MIGQRDRTLRNVDPLGVVDPGVGRKDVRHHTSDRKQGDRPCPEQLCPHHRARQGSVGSPGEHGDEPNRRQQRNRNLEDPRHRHPQGRTDHEQRRHLAALEARPDGDRCEDQLERERAGDDSRSTGSGALGEGQREPEVFAVADDECQPDHRQTTDQWPCRRPGNGGRKHSSENVHESGEGHTDQPEHQPDIARRGATAQVVITESDDKPPVAAGTATTDWRHVDRSPRSTS